MDCPSAVPDEGTEGGGNDEGEAAGKGQGGTVTRAAGEFAEHEKIRKRLRNQHRINQT